MTIEDLKNHIKSFRDGKLNSDEITKFFQEFIDGDPKIINSTYLKETPELKPLYSFLVYHRKEVLLKLSFPKSYKPKNAYAHLKSVEAIQKFIDDNNILSPGDMEKRFRGANTMRSKLSVEDQNKIKWPQYSRISFRNIKTIEDLQRLIDKKDIRQPIELKTKVSDSLYGLYYRKFSKEERSKIKWKNDRPVRKLPEKSRDWSSIDNIEKLQQFVYDNQVVNKTDLNKRFRGLYRKFKGQLSKIKFVGPMTLTRGEAFLIKKLIMYNVNFLYQKTYPDCKKTMACRFDFYLIDYNILLEYHGEAHFGDGIRYTEKLIENDKLKNKYAKDHGIPIYYFTLNKKLYDSVGYFTKVYTDVDELFSDMGIDITTPNPNYKRDLQKFFSQDIDYFNSFILRNKVKSLKDLRKRFSTIATRVRARGLKEYLVYYTDS